MQRYEIITNFAHMRESVRSIEAISLCFTAGVVTGTVLFPGTGVLLPALLLPVLALPCLFRSRLLGAPESVSAGIILLTFLLAGIFAARSAALPAASTIGPIERLADGAAQSLRSVIGSLPFPSGETAPLLSAFLTGDRSGLTPQTTALFRDSGASHLLALSGLHMGILYLVFDALTKPLGHTPEARRLRFVLLTAGTGFFTLMTGAGPSVVRAFLFITISETLRLKQRPRSSARVYCMALLIQLVLDPSVIGSLGFQLSYLAMAGIFLVYPILERWYPEGSRYNPLRWLWNTAALSISCQLFTAPLVWMRFHTFPRLFLLTNLLVLPLMSALMITAVLTVGLAAIGLPWQPLITTTDGLCRLLRWILEIICGV